MERRAKESRKAPRHPNFEDSVSEILWLNKQKGLAIKKRNRNHSTDKPQNEKEHAHALLLKNIPYRVDAKTVLNFVVDRTGIDRNKVISCEVLKEKDGRSRGQVYLKLADYAQVEKIKNSTQNRILGSLNKRQISFEVRSAPPRSLPADQTPEAKSYSLVRFALGEQDGYKSFVMRWGIPDLLPSNGRQVGAAKKFVFNPLSRQLSWTFTYNDLFYEFRVSMDQLRRKIDVDQPREKCLKLTISLRNPPEVYQNNGRSQRTGDFTGYNVVGQCLIHHLELEVSTEDRLELLRTIAPHTLFKGVRDLSSYAPFFETIHKEVTSSSCPASFPDSIRMFKFEVRYALEVLISKGALTWSVLGPEFYEYLKRQEPSGHAVPILDAIAAQGPSGHGKFIAEPRKELKKWARKLTNPSSRRTELPGVEIKKANIPEGMVHARRVTITPTRIFVHPVELGTSNRVLREFKKNCDRFLRVAFRDENFNFLPRHAPKLMEIEKGLLQNGFWLGGRCYRFLAFSESQLGEASAWFFSNTDEPTPVTVESIRSWMGDFSNIRNVSKYAARMGQCFSSTLEGPLIRENQWKVIEDIKRNGYCFSDGCGIMSEALGKKLTKKTKERHQDSPSAYQIRFNGAKGMVSVWPESVFVKYSAKPGVKLLIRESMNKFEVDHNRLEFLAYSTLHPAFLNRQLIVLLSTRGVPDEVFLELQENMLDSLSGIFQSGEKALAFVRKIAGDEETKDEAIRMIKAGFDVSGEPFLREQLRCLRRRQLQSLEGRTHIFVPSAAHVFGIMDETNTLEYGEFFLQRYGHDTNHKKIILEDCDAVVAKNPAMHPGDIRVLRARGSNVPDALKNIVNCIVFPSRGPRPHPNECSGGDLDGDSYFVTWDPQLIPNLRKYKPMDYSPAKTKEKTSPVTVDDIIDFFVHFPSKDELGKIANAHLANADLSERNAEDPKCIALAKLHSRAVDYKKTGVPASMQQELEPQSYPSFMRRISRPEQHISKKVIGKMYSRVREFANNVNAWERPTDISILPSDEDFDHGLKISGYEEYVGECNRHLKLYQLDLTKVMEKFGVDSEVELLTGTVRRFGKEIGGSELFSDTWKQANIEVRNLCIQHRYYFKYGLPVEALPSRGVSDRRNESELNPILRASANYVVAYERAAKEKRKTPDQQKETRGLLSFPWIVSGRQLCAIKRRLRGASLPKESDENIDVYLPSRAKGAKSAVRARENSSFSCWATTHWNVHRDD